MTRGRSGWRWIADVLRAIAADRAVLLLLIAAVAMLVIVALVLRR